MSDITGTRLLRKQIPRCELIRGEGSPHYLEFQVGEDNGWELYWNDVNVPFLIYRTYFDISGWSREQLSAFIGGVGWQEAESFHVADPNPVPTFGEVCSWDIASKAKLPNNILDHDKWLNLVFNWSAPGFSNSNYDQEEIFAGRYRQFLPNSTQLGLLHQTAQEIWGCGDATAGDKIYVTRIISPSMAIDPGNTANNLIVPAQNIIVNAAVVDEKDLVYMERLRRSYVLGESRNP